MYWIANGFIFRRINTPYHNLDPRVKLLISIELFGISLVAFRLVHLAVAICFMLLICLIAKVLGRAVRTMTLSAGFAAFILVINLLFGQSLVSSIIYSMRFVAIVLSTSTFFLTTTPDELEQVMKWMRFPRDMVFAFVTAVRFIPVLMLDAIQIIDAQKSRGLEVEKGSIIKRIRNMIPILIPLVVNSVIRSGELAEAMESRAYGAVDKPTSLYNYTARKMDKLIAVASLILFFTALYIYLSIPVPL